MNFLCCCEVNEKFNSEKWKSKPIDWWSTDIREKMVNDLIESQILINKTSSEVIIILGEPSEFNDKQMKYLIREKYTNDIDPNYIKNLIIHFQEDRKAYKCEIKA